MKKLLLGMTVILAAAPLASRTALADYGRHEGWHEGRHWHGDIRSFHERDIARWRTGHWYQGRHGGRHGWWWVVGGVWYLYGAPVYPYPDPYVPPIVVQQSPPVYVEQPATVVAPVPPPVVPPVQVAPPPPAPVTQYWYYCKKPQGYYPYVPQCKVAWDKVPATPPQ